MDATPSTAGPSQRSTPEERSRNARHAREYRKRQREGGVTFRMQVDSEDIAALIAIGALNGDQVHEPDAVKRAVMLLSSEGYAARKANKAGPQSQPARMSVMHRSIMARLAK